MKWLSIATMAALIISCFFPWISIESKNIVVTGFNASAINFGEPGMIHTVLGSIFIILLLLNKIWSLRIAFFISTFNIAWAIRNFFALSTCSGGECPVRHTALYVVLISSVLACLFMLFIQKKVDEAKATQHKEHEE
ncbi:MAG: hypothetical protein ACTHMD_13080 [Flavisolibacter sp.]